MDNCKECKFWKAVFFDRYGDFISKKEGAVNSDYTGYGECEKAISVYGRGQVRGAKVLTKQKTPIILIDSEGYGGARMYTHEGFGCRCFEQQ